MRKEMYRVFISPIIYVIVGVMFVFINVFCIVVCSKTDLGQTTNIYSQSLVEKYQSEDELEAYLQNTITEKSLLNPESSTYETSLELLKHKIALYKYLIANYMPYEQAVDFDVIIYSPSTNFYSFNATAQAYVFVFMTVLNVALVIMLFSSDFDNGSYKYIYCKGDRLKTLIRKTTAIVAVSYTVLFIMNALINVYSCSFYNGIQQSVLLYTNGKIVLMQKSGFVLLNIGSTLFFNLFDLIFILGIFLLAKKTVAGMFVYLPIYLFSNLYGLFISSLKAFDALFTLPLYNLMISYESFIFGIFFKIAISLLLFVPGAIKILKDDL